MHRIIKIFYNPKRVFKDLDNFYEEDLDTNSNLIASIFGLVAGIYSWFANPVKICETMNVYSILACVIMVMSSAGICILLYNYIFTYLLYWLGRLLGSKGVVADTRTAIAYSLIPVIINICVLFFQQIVFDSFQFWFFNVLSLFIWTWAMVIMTIGLKILNKYGIFKAIINVLPMPVFGILLVLIKYFYKN